MKEIFAMYQKEDVRARKILVGALNDCLDYRQHLCRVDVKLKHNFLRRDLKSVNLQELREGAEV